MRKAISMSVVAMLLASLFAVQNAQIKAQDDAKKTDAAKKEDAKKSACKKPRGRLPNFYAKLGISSKQRTAIYGIQSEYKSKIDELKKQIATLETEQKSKVEAVLSDAQKKRLTEVLKEAQERSSKRKASAKTSSTKKESAE